MRQQALFAAMVGLALAASSPAVAGRQPEPGGPGDQAGFTYYQRCIFIRMQARHHENLLFLVDTGASASAIDLNAAERLRLVVRGAVNIEGTAGVIRARTAVIPSLSVGKVNVDNLRVTAQDLGGSLAPPAMKLDGILGYDFLSHYAITIDFKARVIGFHKKPSRADLSGAAAVRFALDRRIPRLRGVLNGRVNAEFRLDTGASLFETSDVYLNVTENTWRRLTHSEPGLAAERYFQGSGPGGTVRLPVARLKECAIGSIVVMQPYAIVQPAVGYFARPDAVGFISNNFLERYSPVTIDYRQRRLYLSKGATVNTGINGPG